MVLLKQPPKMVYDDAGRLVEVIVSADDFRAYLRELMAEADWESLPNYLQDAVDQLLIEEVRTEKEGAVDLGTVLMDDSLEP